VCALEAFVIFGILSLDPLRSLLGTVIKRFQLQVCSPFKKKGNRRRPTRSLALFSRSLARVLKLSEKKSFFTPRQKKGGKKNQFSATSSENFCSLSGF
jgi:hypothetical protein